MVARALTLRGIAFAGAIALGAPPAFAEEHVSLEAARATMAKMSARVRDPEIRKAFDFEMKQRFEHANYATRAGNTLTLHGTAVPSKVPPLRPPPKYHTHTAMGAEKLVAVLDADGVPMSARWDRAETPGTIFRDRLSLSPTREVRSSAWFNNSNRHRWQRITEFVDGDSEVAFRLRSGVADDDLPVGGRQLMMGALARGNTLAFTRTRFVNSLYYDPVDHHHDDRTVRAIGAGEDESTNELPAIVHDRLTR